MKHLLVLNTGWMNNYSGISGDAIKGGFKYLKDHKEGHEAYNFSPKNGKCYGFAPIMTETINIDRLGAQPEDVSIDDVTIVWTAKREGFGKCVVGWYNNATVYRSSKTRMVKGKEWYYYAKTDEHHAVLIPPDERNLHISGASVAKTSASWFLDETSEWFSPISEYIMERPTESLKKVTKKLARSTDPIKKTITEQAAMEVIKSHYRQYGYTVEECHKENLGWDLEATLGKVKLRLEVKGLAGHGNQVELTPNEYNKMRDKVTRNTFRICIVTGAGSVEGHTVFSKKRIFQYDPSSASWLDEEGALLRCQQVESARLSF